MGGAGFEQLIPLTRSRVHAGRCKRMIEILGCGSHARDIETGRFKDLCMKQAMLSLDDWLFLPIAYLSIKEDPSICNQLVFSFVGKFTSLPALHSLDWIENETIRYARRLLRPFTSKELASFSNVQRSMRGVFYSGLYIKHRLPVVDEKQRYRTWQLSESRSLKDIRDF